MTGLEPRALRGSMKWTAATDWAGTSARWPIEL